MASVMTNSLSIESGALAVPEPDASGVRAYKGIPYAAPPVGQLRWRPPEPAAPWTGVRPTHEFGAHSVQGVVWDDIDLSGAATSEDCLHLNVWTPAAPGTEARLPVMVWIHGGGFVVGSGAEARYDGARLAARGIVVVTVNHRLNALGFLAHPELTAESEHHSSGAYGFLDLVAALQMGQAQHRRFRRRSRQVTIAGESAGSAATSALMASPLAKGLFARVIGESGAMFAAPAAHSQHSRKPKPTASTSCAKSERVRWPKCARVPLTPFSPGRPGLASARSSMDGFCRALLPKSSPQANTATCR